MNRGVIFLSKELWHCYCKDCKSFCEYGRKWGNKKFWCKVENKSVMPFSSACEKYDEK